MSLQAGAAPAKFEAHIVDWNRLFINEVREQSLAPALVARNLSLLHLAAYDAQILATRSEDGVSLGTPFLAELQSIETIDDLDPGLVSSAAFSTILGVVSPGCKGRADALMRSLLEDSQDDSAIGVTTAKRSQELGARVAQAYLEARASDGASRTVTYVPSDVVGHWRRTPPRFRPPELPGWDLVAPFCLESADQFRPPPPPSLDSKAYALALKEVKKLGRQRAPINGDSTAETAEFWSCFSRTSTPVGHWNLILGRLLRERNHSGVKAARAFAVLNIALSDAAVACWDCKYHYRLWRPIDAIRLANDDGNDDTKAEPLWESLLEAPPHPEYVSGHSTFAGAGAEVLSRLCKADDLTFETSSDSLPGVTRSYRSFSSCALEMGRSRIFGGIHYAFSDSEGQRLGKRVGAYVWKTFVKRIRSTPTL
ncbi:vanadium-dependent haloperoxidase [Verrucomicrobiales bacterium]|jgi:hypothetical protein|nr:vanadium-dependent haloperoxidase [Verrucomicrobiales bacterium]MDC0503349.1 vanadium-dependent haloperoxidase [Verrucomicrobiales bacterium]